MQTNDSIMKKSNSFVLGKELIVRKRNFRFIEKIFQYQGYVFRHDNVKKIVYAELPFVLDIEEKIKRFYDAYVFLLSNNKSPFCSTIIKIFFYIIYCREPEYDMVMRLTHLFFETSSLPPFERSVVFHMKAFDEMPEIESKDRLLIALILYNYCLVKGNLPTVVFVNKQLEEYEKIKELDNIDKMNEFLLNHMMNSKYQDRKYYQNLVELHYSDLYEVFKGDERMLIEYGIKHLYVFGSFAKSDERIDSDIDLLVLMNYNLTVADKKNNIEIIKNMYYRKFHRFIDITEISEYIDDHTIKELDEAIKVF